MIVDNWSKFVNNPGFCIYFVNPNSIKDIRWIIFPYTHNKICEPSNIKSGLKSLFSNVSEVTKKDINPSEANVMFITAHGFQEYLCSDMAKVFNHIYVLKLNENTCNRRKWISWISYG